MLKIHFDKIDPKLDGTTRSRSATRLIIGRIVKLFDLGSFQGTAMFIRDSFIHSFLVLRMNAGNAAIEAFSTSFPMRCFVAI